MRIRRGRPGVRRLLGELACPVMTPADPAAIASAAPAVRQVREFVDWVGEGRALTQTGRIRRADALALVDLLDTGDTVDP